MEAALADELPQGEGTGAEGQLWRPPGDADLGAPVWGDRETLGRLARKALRPPSALVLSGRPLCGRAASSMEAHPATVGVSRRRGPGSPER